MKHFILIGALITFSLAQAQILKPIKWATSVQKISDTEYDLVATATLEPNWHLYSQTVPENGPIATSFTFAGHPNYLKKGNTKEEPGHTINDPVFDMEITYFENIASFKQRIKVKNKPPFEVTGTVEYMVCDDSRCLPPTELELVYHIK